MKKQLFITFIAVLVTAIVTMITIVYLYEQPNFGQGVILDSFYSEQLREEREVIIHLPESYENCAECKYPVIYVLDGTSQDIHTTYSAALMARIGLMPELIVVGLPNTSGSNRQRDYTPPFLRRDIDETDHKMGEGDQFLSFIKAEVIPRIEQKYQASSFRMIAGNSRGGLLVAYSLLAEPELFDARFAHSPALWRENELFNKKLGDFFQSKDTLESFFYMSLGSEENEKMTRAFNNAIQIFETKSPEGLTWEADFTLGANHGNNAVRATPVGFKKLGNQPILNIQNN